jgi:mannosylglycerate hydrolase
VLENSAHDSICGCSIDAVADQVLVRYAEAEQIADGLVRQAAARVAADVPRRAHAVLNPSPYSRTDVVVLDVTVPEDWPDVALAGPGGIVLATQELARSQPFLFRAHMKGSEVPSMFSRVHGRELFGRWLNGYDVDDSGGRPRITLAVGDEPDPPWLDTDELRREVELAAHGAPEESWEVRILAAPRRALAAAVPAPPLGWTALRPTRGVGTCAEVVEVSERGLRNAMVAVDVEPAGTLRLEGGEVTLTGVGRLVDGGDAGDSYNYAPPRDDELVDTPEEVRVEVRAGGPLVGRLAVLRTYRWPLGTGQEGRSDDTTLVSVEMEVELRVGEPFVRVRFSFDNPCVDHRLRVHVPLALRVGGSAAEGQFAVVERGLAAEGGHGEVPLPTFPARGFVAAGGVAVLPEHVLEYEVVNGSELALTLLRATGLISRNTNRFRADPAGPEIEAPGAQGLGRRSVALAVYPHAGSWAEANVLAEMERYAHPFVTAAGSGAGEVLATAVGLELEGEGVVLSSLRRRGEWLELRLVCERSTAADVTLTGDFYEVRDADLLGRPRGELESEDGRLTLRLEGWEIRTLQLGRPPAAD